MFSSFSVSFCNLNFIFPGLNLNLCFLVVYIFLFRRYPDTARRFEDGIASFIRRSARLIHGLCQVGIIHNTSFLVVFYIHGEPRQVLECLSFLNMNGFNFLLCRVWLVVPDVFVELLLFL